MGSIRIIAGVAAAALWVCCSSAEGAQTERFVCKRVSGGPMSDLSFTVDYDAKMVSVAGYAYNPNDPSEVTITDAKVSWSFMRGFMDLDRKSGDLVWDTTAEYAYLDAIGHLPDEPESDYRGAMRCARVATNSAN